MSSENAEITIEFGVDDEAFQQVVDEIVAESISQVVEESGEQMGGSRGAGLKKGMSDNFRPMDVANILRNPLGFATSKVMAFAAALGRVTDVVDQLVTTVCST